MAGVISLLRSKPPSPQHTTALWGRTDGANLRNGLFSSVTGPIQVSVNTEDATKLAHASGESKL
jgi:hypothetical protein